MDERSILALLALLSSSHAVLVAVLIVKVLSDRGAPERQIKGLADYAGSPGKSRRTSVKTGIDRRFSQQETPHCISGNCVPKGA